jgi:predicted kinase
MGIDNKKVQKLIGGIISKDQSAVDKLIREITESVLRQKQNFIIDAYRNTVKGNTDV